MAYLAEIEHVVCDGEQLFPERRAFLPTRMRYRDLVVPRQLVMYFLKLYNGENMSWAKIGATYRRDHATAMHAIKTINNLIDTDKVFAAKVEAYRVNVETIITFETNVIYDNLEGLKSKMRQLIDDGVMIPQQMVTSYNYLAEKCNTPVFHLKQRENKAAS